MLSFCGSLLATLHVVDVYLFLFRLELRLCLVSSLGLTLRRNFISRSPGKLEW